MSKSTANRLDALLWDIARTYVEMNKVLDDVEKELEDEDKEDGLSRERWDFIDQ